LENHPTARRASKVPGQRAEKGHQDENEKMSTVEGYLLERIFHTAEESAAQKTADSVILDQEAEDALPKFELSGTLFSGRVRCIRTYRTAS
jgi:hypothetical protein